MLLHRIIFISTLVFPTAGLYPARAPWMLRLDGIGAFRIGMSVPALRAALHQPIDIPTEPDEHDCFYVEPNGHPGVAIMVLHCRVARVDVETPEVATATGIHVGDSEQRLKDLYGASLKVEPDYYDAETGHYLTLLRGHSMLGIRFETENSKVTNFHAGTREAIVLVEGCS